MEQPRVSIITPTTKSRTKFVELLFRNILSQTYPHHLLEWVVVGDSDDFTANIYKDLFHKMETISQISCRYFCCDIEKDIGKKRNFACARASHKILAFMDDDDVYNEKHLEYSVSEMKKRGVNLVGCRDMLIFFPLFGGKMTYVNGSRVHEATIVCRKHHWKTTKFREKCMQGEGASLVQGSYFNEMDISKVMICIAHTNNTYDKTKLLNSTEIPISESTRDELLGILKDIL